MRARTAHTAECHSCGYANELGELVCAMCGDVIGKLPPELRRERESPVGAPVALPRLEPAVLGIPRPWFYLILGVPIALVLSWGPASFVGWFLSALVHEIGHTVTAWMLGCVAYPAIRLDGHAAAFHQGQSLVLVLVAWGALGLGAWRFRRSGPLLVVFGGAILIHPILAFTRARDLAHLAAGHLGELVFATIFFWRAFTGGFVKKAAERPLYSALGWLWMGGNIFLFASLMWSMESRQWYLSNGSFGIDNDLVRVARQLGMSISSVALPMLLISLAPLPLALFFRRQHPGAATPDEL